MAFETRTEAAEAEHPWNKNSKFSLAPFVEALQRKVQGVTRGRMLREMAEAIEALTAERPLVLVFEDLHWSDDSTLELLAYLARRREPARLLVIGTYRPHGGDREWPSAERDHPGAAGA